MNSKHVAAFRPGVFKRALVLFSVTLLALIWAASASAQSSTRGLPVPGFTKSFVPSTIGPGSTTTLRFDIENLSGSSISGLAFTDNLPAGVTIADPASALSDCGGTLSAPADGTAITLSGGSLSGGQTCSIFVNVTSSTIATHTNVSGDLTSSAGNSGTATADLVVATDRPGFSKSFSPATLNIGARGTLTFTLDNSANANFYLNPTFTDAFPPGIEVADPPNASTDCPGSVFNASAGANSVSMGIGAPTIIPAGSTCTAVVDVKAAGVGIAENVSGELLTSSGGPQVSSGFATDSIEVTADQLVFQKAFIDDPVLPGSTVVLEFSILNTNRSDSATGITFTDNLDAVLSGLVAVDTPVVDPCGGGSILSGTSLLTLSDGSLGPGEGCSFSVTLQVPAATPAGAYPNTTSTIAADVGGSPVAGAPAAETLFVNEAPSLTKTFLTNPVGAGGTTQIEFTVTNNSSTSAASDITFNDNITQFLSGATVTSGFQSNICGAGSSLSTQPISGDTVLVLSGGNLAAGASCTFTADLQIPEGQVGGPAVNSTGSISATVDEATQVGNPASDTLTVVGAPTLRKQFTDDPVQPGDTVTLEFTLSHDAAATDDATGITFTDDLDAVLTGLVATGLPASNVCGAGSQISGAGVLTLTGGTLAPGASCTFPITLQVPAGALPGSYTNTTSNVSATVDGVTTVGDFAADQLDVTGLNFSKQFIDSPVIAGATTTLRFTIENTSASSDVADLFFTDSLTGMLSGAAAVAPLPTEPCGVGSSISGTTSLVFAGGNLAAGTSCTFDVTVQVPPLTPDNSYLNATSNLGGSIGGEPFSLPPASAPLEVDSNFLLLAKSFTDDPAFPGGSVNLEFTLTNGNANEAVTGIGFTDDLDASLSGLVATGLPTNDVCGAGSQLSGTGLLTLAGGTLPAGGACTFSVTLQLPAAVAGSSFVNTTSSVTGTAQGASLPVGGSPASDTLEVNNVAFTKSFDGPSTATGNPVLTFNIENLSASNGVSGLSFTDNLNAVLAGLTAIGTPAGDLCGAGSQLSGTTQLTFVGGTLGPNESCSIEVTLAVPATATTGQYVNTTSSLTSNGLQVATPATATLQIEPPPTFAKVFFPNAISVGGTSTLTFTIDNSASIVAAGALAFTDNLPAGLAVATPANTSSTCGGTVSATAGAASVGFSGGNVTAGGTCTVQVDVTGTSEGNLVNVSGPLTSTSGNSGTASDAIDVISGEFVVTKSFRTEPVLPGGAVELELSIVNGSTFPLTDVALTDDLDAALTGLIAEGLPLADVCGTGSQVTGTSLVSLTGGNLVAGASCTIVIPVRLPTGTAAGTYVNTTSPATGTREGLPVQADADSADLVVEPLSFGKSFSPALVPVGGTTTAVFEITNPDPANAASGLTFSDDLDAFVPGMTAANTPIADACGAGSLVDGTSTITLTDGAIGPGGSCTIQVVLNVPAGTPPGDFTNTTSALAGATGSTQTGAAAARAVLGIQPLPTFTKAFSPTAVLPRESATLTFVIDNSGSQLAADSLAFDDNLPAGMTVAALPAIANTCGGTLSAVSGSGLVQLTGGSVPAGAVCQVHVNVTVGSSGTFTNVTDDLTSGLGNSGNATATLNVSQAIPVPLLNAAWLALLTLMLAALGMHALTKP